MKGELTDLERLRDALVGDGCHETEEWMHRHAKDVETILVELTQDEPQLLSPERRSKRFLYPGSMIAAVVVFMGCAAGVGWWYLSDRPLLRDNFNDGWYDSSLWQSPPPLGPNIGVAEDDDVMHLVNRGYLVTQDEFAPPIALSLDWKWQREGLLPTYSDALSIALRTTGTPEPRWAYECQDGVVLTFSTWGGNVYARLGGSLERFASTATASVPMPPGRWARIRITDDGARIRVWFAPRGTPNFDALRPALEFDSNYRPKAQHIAIYNRENVAGVHHESQIDNVEIARLRVAGQ